MERGAGPFAANDHDHRRFGDARAS